MNFNNIVFFCPSKLTGGTEYLFVRLAEYLLDNQNKYAIYYCDYPDGFSHTRWHSEKVHYLDYVDKEHPITIPPNSVVIAQLNLISQPERFLIERNNSVIIYWMLHSLNIKSQIFRNGIYFLTIPERKSLGKEIRLLSEKGIIKYMGYGAYSTIIRDFYQEPCEFSWLPNIAPIKADMPKPEFARISSDEVRFCWLGRLDEEKARNILTYMNELEDVCKKQKLTFSLIGRGPAEEMLKKESLKYSYPIEFVGEKRDAELDVFIRSNTEIGFASGTSAFEFSMRGKPVIMQWVIDKVYPAGECDNYIFTEENEKFDYSTGHALKRKFANTFKNKLNEILQDYATVSRNGYDFVMCQSAGNCASVLLETINKLSQSDGQEIYSDIDKVSHLINKGNRRMKFLSKIKKIVKFQ